VQFCKIVTLRIACLVLGAALLASVPIGAQDGTYTIGPQDVLRVRVTGQADLTGNFSVDDDGTLNLPLVGRITAAGLTAAAFEKSLAAKLVADGLLRRPQVSVAIETYRSQRIFVVGRVRAPAAYTISGKTSLTEALVKAGWLTDETDAEILLVRSARGNAQEPEVMQFDLARLRTEGPVTMVRENDTISVSPVVARPAVIFVYGQVRNPGLFPLLKETTVRNAVGLAGGLKFRSRPTDTLPAFAISRIVDGKRVELQVHLDDRVFPGDAVLVP
jgi:polysaccharide export outer membrane protein